jgi:two-component system, cell cycle response regulator DivK
MLGDVPSPTVGSPAGKRILIVEDNELNMRLLNDVLEAHGYVILKTGLGEAAIELAHRFHPDLILMDLQLPDISGLEATRRLKADEATRGIAIVAVTAFAMSGDERKARDAGCDGYIAKPFMLQPFLAVVERFVGGAVTLL